MTTIGEVYNPLIDARHDQEKFNALLIETGKAIFENNYEETVK